MIFICGYRAHGKSTVSKILRDNNYYIFDVGQFLRSKYEEVTDKIENESFDDYLNRKISNKEVPNWILLFIFEEMSKNIELINMSKDLVVVGLQSRYQIELFKRILDKIPLIKRESEIFFVEASEDIAKKRYLSRNIKNTGEEYDLNRLKEGKTGLEEISNSRDVKIINNDGNTDELKKQLSNILGVKSLENAEQKFIK
jgi:dephospho-CoA kinase